MDLQTTIQVIGNVGFPIALCLILLQSILVQFNKHLDGLDKRLAQLDQTIHTLIRTFHENEAAKASAKQDG